MNIGINLNQSSNLMRMRLLLMPKYRHVLLVASHMLRLSLLSGWGWPADSTLTLACLWIRSISMKVCHGQRAAGTVEGRK